jgi:hypothetical protein
MKRKTIRIGDYVFLLTFSSTTPDELLSSHFMFAIYFGRDMTDQELIKGRKLQKKIYNGDYKEYIDNTNWDLLE